MSLPGRMEIDVMNATALATLSEAELIRLAQRSLPSAVQRRYRALIERRELDILTPEEHRELLRLADQFELHDAERLEYLAILVQRRGVSLRQLMDELNLYPRDQES